MWTSSLKGTLNLCILGDTYVEFDCMYFLDEWLRSEWVSPFYLFFQFLFYLRVMETVALQICWNLCFLLSLQHLVWALRSSSCCCLSLVANLYGMRIHRWYLCWPIEPRGTLIYSGKIFTGNCTFSNNRCSRITIKYFTVYVFKTDTWYWSLPNRF